MSGRLVDTLPALSTPARAALLAAVELARTATPPDGIVPGGVPALARVLQRSRYRVHVAVAELERAGLVRRIGQTRAARLFVVELVTVSSEIGPRADIGSGDWRTLRARVGGLERAIREVQEQRDQAKRENDALRRGRRLDANASLVGLLADLDHAADCALPSCRRCLEIGRRVDAGRAEYLPEAELLEQLEAAGALRAAGIELLDAMRDRGVGAAARRGDAARAFARLLDPAG
jgi:hypothetical protein